MIGEDEYLAGELVSEFRAHLRNSPCTPLTSDMRVKVGKNYYYPDVTVDCEFDISQPNHCDTPAIIVEVLSKSTRQADLTARSLSENGD